MWLASWYFPQSLLYPADCCQLIPALTLVTECDDFRAVLNEAVASEKYLYFIDSKRQLPYASWSNFVLVILIFHKFFQVSWQFALKMDCSVHISDVLDAFIIPYYS